MEHTDKLLLPAQVATMLGVTRNTLYSYVAQNTIPHVRVGKFIRFEPAELTAWIASRRKASQETSNG